DEPEPSGRSVGLDHDLLDSRATQRSPATLQATDLGPRHERDRSPAADCQSVLADRDDSARTEANDRDQDDGSDRDGADERRERPQLRVAGRQQADDDED